MYVVATERGTRRGEERRWTRRIQVGRREEISQMRAREGGDVSVKKIKNRVGVSGFVCSVASYTVGTQRDATQRGRKTRITGEHTCRVARVDDPDDFKLNAGRRTKREKMGPPSFSKFVYYTSRSHTSRSRVKKETTRHMRGPPRKREIQR